MALIFTRLGALEVFAPPPYVFLIGGLLSPFSNCPLLMASLILIPQSHNSPKELIDDDKSLLLYVRSKFLIIIRIWSFSFGLLITLDAFPFHLVMSSENVSPTPCLVVSKSLKVTSIMVLKLNWSTTTPLALPHLSLTRIQTIVSSWCTSRKWERKCMQSFLFIQSLHFGNA